ncbi:hypothetical protein QPK14_03355 [Photorhabdus temperata subsp. temperata]
MRYRREDENGDYSFGQGDNTFLTNSPEAVALAVKTRLALWRGEWFLDMKEGTPYVQSVLGKQRSDVYILAVRDRILKTKGVKSILSFDTHNDGTTRRLTFTATIDTLYGQTTVTSEA